MLFVYNTNMERKIARTSGLLVLFCIFSDIKFLFTCSKVIWFNIRINDSYDSFLGQKIYCSWFFSGCVYMYYYVLVCLWLWVCKFLNFIESFEIRSKDFFEILHHDRVP